MPFFGSRIIRLVTEIRLALDLGDEAQVGRFQYLVKPQSRVGLPEVGELISFDADDFYEMQVIAITSGYEGDGSDAKIVWGRPKFKAPLEDDELWSSLGFRPAWFERFDVDGKRFTAAQLLDRVDSQQVWAQLRQSGKHVAVTVVVAVAAAAAVGESSEGEHLIHMGVDELIELIRALA